MHNDDAYTHKCDALDIPDKGTPIKKGKTKQEAALV